MGRKKTDTPMRKVNHFLTVEQIERIDALALKTGEDRSAIIREAVDAHLNNKEGLLLVPNFLFSNFENLDSPDREKRLALNEVFWTAFMNNAVFFANLDKDSPTARFLREGASSISKVEAEIKEKP